MSTAKLASPKTRTRASSDGSSEIAMEVNLVDLAQRSIDLTEITLMASCRLMDAVIGYGSELQEINNNVVTILTTNSRQGTVGINTAELIEQLQRVADANSRLLDASTAACQALTAPPPQVP